MIKKTPLSLYLHIPFCVKKCSYCDFPSAPDINKQQPLYVKALEEEIKSQMNLSQSYQVKSIFFGGGTPSLLTDTELITLMEAIRKTFHIQEESAWNLIEITIEANPKTLTKDKLSLYRALGINRISLGLQSANQEELNILGRIHTWEDFLENYHTARAVGFQNINIDLMSALPLQTLAKWKITLDKVIALRPEHISAYSLIIEPETDFYPLYGENGSKESDIPCEETDREIYIFTKQYLEQAGYNRYEISNYARPPYECIHNKTYWTGGEYIGFGLSSSSLMNHQRWKNESDINRYLKYSAAPDKIRCERETLTKIQQMEEFMFLGLRLMKGISITHFQKKFNLSFTSIYGTVTETLKKQHLLSQKEDTLFLTDLGTDLSNYVLAEFLLPHDVHI